MKISPNAPCPCGLKRKYKRCCGSLHRGKAAPTPEALMRSRYSAYALHNITYLMESVHPDSPHYRPQEAGWRLSMETFCRSTRFEKLDILSIEQDETDEVGWVTFRATLFQGEDDVSFTERSLFRRFEGKWKYVSAV